MKEQVMIVTPARFPGYTGDTANYMEIVNKLITDGFRLILICPRDDRENEFSIPSKDLTIIRIPYSPPRLGSIGGKNKLRIYIEILLFLIAETATVFRAITKFRSHRILMRHSIFTLQLPLLLKLMNVHVVADGELVADSLSGLAHPIFLKLFYTFEKRLIRLYPLFKVSTEAQAKKLRELGLPDEKIIKIPVSIDISKIPRHPVERIPAKTFGYFGALEPWEGLNTLLEAFLILVKSTPDALLYVIGEGSCKTALQHFASMNGLSSSVVFVGGVTREVLWNEYFQKFRVVVIPRPRLNNSIDSIPSIKLFEALASGKPIITTNIAAMREVASKSLKLVRPGDPTLLAEAMQETITDDSKINEYSKESFAAADYYDIKRNINKLTTALLSR